MRSSAGDVAGIPATPLSAGPGPCLAPPVDPDRSTADVSATHTTHTKHSSTITNTARPPHNKWWLLVFGFKVEQSLGQTARISPPLPSSPSPPLLLSPHYNFQRQRQTSHLIVLFLRALARPISHAVCI
eukprot:3754386-Rhodomonas_salina.2